MGNQGPVCLFACLKQYFRICAADEKSGQQYCGSSKTVTLQLKGGQKFIIPEAYLYDPYGMYYDGPKDQMSFISLMMNKNDVAPNCNKNDNPSEDFLSVTIRPNNFEKTFAAHKEDYGHLAGSDETFKTYRKDTKAVGWETKDFIVPNDPSFSAFFECVYSYPKNSDLSKYVPQRLGCSAYYKIDDAHLIIYSIPAKYLPDSESISLLIKNKILEFKNW